MTGISFSVPVRAVSAPPRASALNLARRSFQSSARFCVEAPSTLDILHSSFVPCQLFATDSAKAAAETVAGAKPKRGKVRKWVVRFARTTLLLVLGTSGYICYRSYNHRHPPAQLQHDPSKKRLVVLGNGWGATSFLKTLDTTEYNVVRPSTPQTKASGFKRWLILF